LLQEFDLVIKDKKGSENMVADHLSRIVNEEVTLKEAEIKDKFLRRCVTNEEAKGILWHCHNSPCGRHYGRGKTTAKVLQSEFFWPTLFKDAHHHVLKCDQCQRMGGIY